MVRSPPGAPRVAMVLLLLVAGATVGVAHAAATTAIPTAATPGADTAGDDLDLNFTTSLTPARPGEVDVTARLSVPGDVTSLTATVPADATVTATEGFTRRGDRKYEWTRTTDRPSLTYRLPVNVTVTRGREGAETSGYLYADPGEWALVRAPSLGVTYSGTGPRPTIRTTQSVAGAGVAGDSILFLGPAERETRTVDGQRLRLVVPEAATLRESRADVLDSLAAAARTTTLGPADESVLVVAAPTTGIEYGSTGLQRGPADMWVRDVQRLDTPDNVWVHEYVHTRQSYRPTDETRWTFEGMADYYAVTRALETGRINYSRYRRHLSIGTRKRYDDVVLAEPSTWEGTTAHYWKGALAFAAVDRRIRVESGGDATLQDALRRAQARADGRLNQSTLLAAIERTGGPESRALARELTETSAAAEPWNRSTHARVFGLADVTARFSRFRIEGRYRNATVRRLPTLVPGERVTVRAVARNGGTEAGDYAVTLRVDDRAVGTRTGRLAPGESATLSWTVPFDSTGERRFVLGESARSATVRRPATPAVTALQVPETARVGESVGVRATVANRADRPAGGTVRLRATGAVLTERRVGLAPGDSTDLTARTAFGSPGEYTVAAGDRTATLRVLATPTATDAGGAGSGDRGVRTGTPTATDGDGASTDGDGASTDGDGASTDGDGASTDGDGASTDGDGASTDGDGASTTTATPGTGTPSDAGAPGFGVVAALAGLLVGAALLARRRPNR